MSQLPKKYEELLQKVASGTLTEVDSKSLEVLLKKFPELRADFIAYCQMDGMLKDSHDAFSGEQRPPVEAEVSEKRTIPMSLMILAAAAAILLAFAVGVHKASNESAGATTVAKVMPKVAPLATFAAEMSAVLTDVETGVGIKKGDSLGNRPYSLDEGYLELRFDTGASVVVEAPAIFYPINKNAMHLSRGRATAQVPPSASGFVMATQGIEVVDLGTEFAMDVPNEVFAEVHVFQGEVLVKTRDDDGFGEDVTRLSAGTALGFFRGNGQATGIDLAKERFVRRLDDPNRTYVDHVLELKPLLYYPMEPNDSATSLRDYSDNHLHATIHGLDDKGARWAPGASGSALQLSGPHQEGFAILDDYPKSENNTLSCVAWIYAESRPQWASLVKNWTGHKPGQFHFGLYDWDGDLEVHVNSDDNREIFAREHVPLPLKEWHQVAFVADGRQLRLYRNGEQVAATRYTGLKFDADVAALAIGTKLWRTNSDPNPGHDFSTWHGKIDDVAIFNHALTEAQIQGLFEAGGKK